MKNISISIPMKVFALESAAGMLLNIADEMKEEVSDSSKKESPETILQKNPVASDAIEQLIKLGKESQKTPMAAPPVNNSPKQDSSIPLPLDNKLKQGSTVSAPINPPSAITITILNGIPWDARIHASTKAMIKNGTEWRIKRGVDRALVEQVTNELRSGMAAQPIIEDESISEAITHSTNEASDIPSPPPELTTAPTNISPLPPLPPGNPESEKKILFPEFLTKITERSTGTHGEAFNKVFNNLLDTRGISVNTLMSREDLLPEINKELDQQWASIAGNGVV